ncbi:hypothetical protein BM536_031645 [Streptomyces phaeoluteigriseus]|uniref:SseB protein N-terminal domain-containing protein n=1 Tax=Streptomyces phaeoluteigriseus TaxID=114686 RepID=A0A1V6MJR5_9ACTN|nr:hypothetical protein [Streptomyces phaeoluteigriseus]OQD52689.1 hypothetical protein BM536_031645 [Streptomyces phaeoluteigriseus]
MSEHGGTEHRDTGGEPPGKSSVPRSRLAEYAEMAVSPQDRAEERAPLAGPDPRPAPEPAAEPVVAPASHDPEVEARRRRFTALLEEFRETPVLVPLGGGPGPDDERGLLTVDWNGVRFILAFSDGQALARYAEARGEYHREWVYQTILGARLLDVAVPAAGVPCGVALDCADGPDGVVFPPVLGVVADEVAVDRGQGEGL